MTLAERLVDLELRLCDARHNRDDCARAAHEVGINLRIAREVVQRLEAQYEDAVRNLLTGGTHLSEGPR